MTFKNKGKTCVFVDPETQVVCGKTPIMARQMCVSHYQQWLYHSKKPPEIPKDLAEKVANARTTEDWQALAKGIVPVMQGILDGTVKGSAAQVGLLKDVLNRAYGKPMATQQDKKVAAGIVILPTLATDEKATVCPRCGYDSLNVLEHDTIKLQLKALYESL